MPKSKRLSHAQFARVTKNTPKRSIGEFCVVISYPLPNDIQGPKFAIVVPKKDFQKAVTRNLVTRRYWGIIRQLVGVINKQYAYVIRPKKEAENTTFKDLKSATNKLFERFNSRDTIR